MSYRLIRVAEVLELRGCKTTKHYQDIEKGIYPAPLKDGVLNVWPESEVVAMNRAIVAGYAEDRLRELVQELHAARTQLEVLPKAAA